MTIYYTVLPLGHASGWSGAADLSECRSVWLSTLTSRAASNDAVLAVAHDLAAVVKVSDGRQCKRSICQRVI